MTHEPRRVAYNSIVQVGGRFLASAIGLVAIGISTRYLGLDLYGQLTIAVIYLSVFSTLADSGLSAVTIRELARRQRPAAEIIGSVTILRSLIAVGLAAVAAAAGFLIYHDPGQAAVRQAILILAGQVVVSTLQNTLTAGLVAKLKNDLIVVGEILGKMVTLAGLFIVTGQDCGFAAVVGAYLLGSGVNLASNLLFGLRDTRPRLRVDPKYWRYLLILSLPLAVSGILNTLYFRTDGFLLSVLRSNTEVGLYGVAYKVVELTMAIPLLFTNTMFPLMAAAHQDTARLQRLTRQSVRVLGILAAPVTAGVIALAAEAAVLLGGPSFAGAAGPMAILMVGNAFIFLAPTMPLTCDRPPKPDPAGDGRQPRTEYCLNLVLIPCGAGRCGGCGWLYRIGGARLLRRYYRRFIGQPPTVITG
jgi:O-antigen/teichoic acid export membrane protein